MLRRAGTRRRGWGVYPCSAPAEPLVRHRSPKNQSAVSPVRVRSARHERPPAHPHTPPFGPPHRLGETLAVVARVRASAADRTQPQLRQQDHASRRPLRRCPRAAQGHRELYAGKISALFWAPLRRFTRSAPPQGRATAQAVRRTQCGRALPCGVGADAGLRRGGEAVPQANRVRPHALALDALCVEERTAPRAARAYCRRGEHVLIRPRIAAAPLRQWSLAPLGRRGGGGRARPTAQFRPARRRRGSRRRRG